MSHPVVSFSMEKLVGYGLTHTESIHYQNTPEELTDAALRLGEGRLTSTGALAIRTGEFTGRSPQDKFIVLDEATRYTVNWNEFNHPLEEHFFHTAQAKVAHYLGRQKEVWIRDGYVCADPRYRLNIRTICEKPWTDLFVHNMFLRPAEDELDDFTPEWTILCAPDLQLNPDECGTRQHNAAIISFTHKVVLIAGTGYTGETKKGIFSILNFILPLNHGVLPMHCAANLNDDGDTAIFFGLSGTGKTTLSADPDRKLIGDDEHGWAADSIFNFEGGCYAKLIHLSEAKEPQIFNAIRPGALVENVQFRYGTDEINFDDSTITENTRVSYPLYFIDNAAVPSVGNVPTHIFFLTCDAYGVLPPISKLTTAQAMYQFISGYTAKVAGTETGITEPKPTFSACFGAPFLPLHPGRYAELLGKKLEESKATVWLINTGWTGGPNGEGQRIKLAYTRAMIKAALDGSLSAVPTQTDGLFGLAIPTEVPGVPSDILLPRNTWRDKEAYDDKAAFLAGLFVQNFKGFADGVSAEVAAAGPELVLQ